MGRQVLEGDWSIRQLTMPTSEPITLAQAKDHLRISQTLTNEDADITDMIVGARSYLEGAYGIRFMPQTVEVTLQQFPRDDRIRLPIWPATVVNYVKYTDVANVERDMIVGTDNTAEVLYRLWKKPAELILPFAKIWPPAVLQMADAVRIGLTVGFTGGSPEFPLPVMSTRAMKLLVGHYYENRSAVTLGTLMKSDPLALAIDHLMANVRLY
jgi:uncharacterized phiE125 gp8 family phage protein